jgi:DNA-binding beta-propeller fold protein YncE
MLPALLLLMAQGDRDLPVFSSPAGDLPARVVPGGTTILPNGRFLTPVGERLYTNTDLWYVALSPNGNIVAGFDDSGITAYAGLRRGPRVKQFKALRGVAPCGRFTADSRQLIVSLGDEGSIAVLDTAAWEPIKRISLNVDGARDSYVNDLVLSKDEKRAYAVDIANQDLVTIDLQAGKVLSRVKAGRQPYALAASEDGTRLYVANIGLFDYSLVTGEPGNKRGITRPPFGFPSREAEKGVEMEGKKVPGLGSPYVPDAQSVYMYRVDGDKPTLDKQAKSGLLIHAPADGGKSVGGSAPNALLVRGNRLYVSNANNDTIQVFDTANLRSVATWKLTPSKELARLRGVIPSGLALSGDGSRLYVCESGLNAIGVLDTKTGKVLGHIPSGWFPMALKLDEANGKMYVAAQKGIGRGPRGRLNPRPRTDERYGLPEMPGMIQALSLPNEAELAEQTRTVLRNNGLLPAGSAPKWPKEIKHVVFITKENHTFDGIFGGLKGAKGEPEYAEFGMNGWIQEKGRDERVPIMPNHIRLAEQFGISDNFYMEPQASGDGHRWLVGVYPSLWTSRVFYAGWDFRPNNDTKGRLISFGSNGSQIPEDYLENGSMWEHLDRGGITFRNYGEGFEFAASDEGPAEARSGVFEVANFPMPKVLFDNTCFEFPVYNTNIPDIARVDWLKEDVEKNFRSKRKALPRLLNVALCNDHGTSAKPEWGYPYVASYMADNDLALGRLVEWLSHQPEWKNMAIFVTQDDPGGDDDHVDRHRSFVLAISPYAKRGYVSHRHTSIMSIIKSIYGIFGLGPNNMFDATASPLDDMFTDTPDFTPYVHVNSDPRVFKPEDTMDPADPQFKKRRGAPYPKMDDPNFMEWLRKRSKD